MKYEYNGTPTFTLPGQAAPGLVPLAIPFDRPGVIVPNGAGVGDGAVHFTAWHVQITNFR